MGRATESSFKWVDGFASRSLSPVSTYNTAFVCMMLVSCISFRRNKYGETESK